MSPAAVLLVLPHFVKPKTVELGTVLVDGAVTVNSERRNLKFGAFGNESAVFECDILSCAFLQSC